MKRSYRQYKKPKTTVLPSHSSIFWLPSELWETILQQLPFLRLVNVWQTEGVQVVDFFAHSIPKFQFVRTSLDGLIFDAQTFEQQVISTWVWQAVAPLTSNRVFVKYPVVTEMIYSSLDNRCHRTCITL